MPPIMVKPARKRKQIVCRGSTAVHALRDARREPSTRRPRRYKNYKNGRLGAQRFQLTNSAG
jgi:hypothetical protein